MAFDQNFRILRSIIPDPHNPEVDITTDFKIFAPYLHVSEVFKDLIVSHTDVGPLFVSEDGVIPLRGERPQDIEQLVKWMSREKGFQITIENVKVLLRLADKFDIEYLLNEIKIFAAHWINIASPSYELWELAARHELEYLEKYCRHAARSKADQILGKGEGLAYYLNRGVPMYMIDRMIRALFAAREAVIQTDYKGGKLPYL